MTDRYAVIGNPVSHSQSPFIHNEFSKATREDMRYEQLFAELGRFKNVVDEFVAAGGKGLNVTLPFKREASRLVNEMTERANVADVVNTLCFRDGKILGDNTDGVGLVRDIISNLDYPIADSSVLLLGAGGAARGVLEPLLAQRPASLVIANRTRSKAEVLVQHFSRWGHVSALGYEQLKGHSFDIVIHATSLGMINELPQLPVGLFARHTLAYDMGYSKGLTPFLRSAQLEKAGMLADGLGMLVEQAAESFFLWRGVRPETRKVTNMLRELLA